jgi:hypothetical protein
MTTAVSVAVAEHTEINLIDIVGGGISETINPGMNDGTAAASGEWWSGAVATYTHVHTPTAPKVNYIIAGFTCEPNVVADNNPVDNVTANGQAMTLIGWQQWGYFNSNKRSLALYALASATPITGNVTISATKTDGTINLRAGCLTGYSSVFPAILDYGQNNPSGFDDGQLQFNIDSGTAPSRAFGIGSQMGESYAPRDLFAPSWFSVSAVEPASVTGARTLDFESPGVTADQIIWVLIADSGSPIQDTSEIKVDLTGLETKDDITVTVSN